jgi:sulfur dioxygenase
VVQCATGNRASAVLALLVGEGAGWEPAAVFEWAAREKLPFLGTQPLRNWVTYSLRALSSSGGGDGGGGGAVAGAGAAAAPAALGGLHFRQLFHRESSTFTYLLGDAASGEAVLIDPVIECAERDLTVARELGLRPVLALNTHVHADHVSAASRLRGLVPGLRSAVAAASGALADVCLAPNQVVPFGGRHLRALATPGHTAGCMSFLLDDGSAVFTGDALLIRGCGRTDFQGGSAPQLFDSVHGALLSLPRGTIVFPGQDYNGHSRSTIGEEADLNPRLGVGRSAGEFAGIMAALGLPRPVLIDVAVPANLRDGILAGAPPGPGIVPPGVCVPCRQDSDSGEPPAPIVW